MFDPYVVLIGGSILVALSYIFDITSRKFKIPSVLFLIGTGIGLKELANFYNIDVTAEFFDVLELLGIIGLIMIVLEAAVDLKITRERLPTIRQSILMALLILVISSIAIALAIMLILSEPFFNSLVYAIPLSVVSSAVLIPSIHTLTQKKKEFMIYEGTFSDIIGIMFFNFVVLQEGSIFSISGLGNILLTILLSIIISYLMVFFFSRMKHSIKLFLMLAILALLYSIGKKFHLSSLLMIFIFGLVLNNARLFFRSKLKDYLDFKVVDLITKDFKIVTSETAFLVRTFFFVAFGLSINLQVFFEPTVILVGSVIVIILYLVRFINFKLFLKTNVLPEIFLAPRGLITILLFFSIPPIYQIQDFSSGILFFVIISTGLIMMIALMVTPEIKADTVTIIDVDMGSAPFTNSEHVEPTGPYCDIEGFNKDESVPVPQERSSEPARLQDTDRIKFGKKK